MSNGIFHRGGYSYDTGQSTGHKSTFVRAYVHGDMATPIGGRLPVQSTGAAVRLSPINSPIKQFVHGNPAIVATVQSSHREQWVDSLNFQLNDDLTAPGARNLPATVFAADTEPEAPAPAGHVRTSQLIFSHRIDLHIYGVVWVVTNTNDDKGAQIGPAAPWSDFDGHLRFVENAYPISSLTIDPLPGIGTQAPNPQPIENLVESRACEERKVGDDRIACVIAQEVAHCLGVWLHTFSKDTPYPRSDGTIGSKEIGIGPARPQPALVAEFEPGYDIMSSQEHTWTSAFTCFRLLEAIANAATGDPCGGTPHRWPSQTDWEYLGDGITGTPALVSWRPNRLDIFGRDLELVPVSEEGLMSDEKVGCTAYTSCNDQGQTEVTYWSKSRWTPSPLLGRNARCTRRFQRQALEPATINYVCIYLRRHALRRAILPLRGHWRPVDSSS